ncbi:MAG: VOC family protein [Acidobacteriota bacterium]
MQLTAYLNFPGQCREAFTTYERILGGKITFIQTHGESPMKDSVPADWQDKVMHATLQVDGSTLMGSDAPPEHYQKPQGFYVSIGMKSHDEGARIFRELSEGGRVNLPFDKTFWSPGFGMLVDRFGIFWMVNCDA